MLVFGISLKWYLSLLAARKYLHIVSDVKHEVKRKDGYLGKRNSRRCKNGKEYQYVSLSEQLEEVMSCKALSSSLPDISYTFLVCSIGRQCLHIAHGRFQWGHCFKLSDFSPSFLLPNNLITTHNIHLSLQIKLYFHLGSCFRYKKEKKLISLTNLKYLNLQCNSCIYKSLKMTFHILMCGLKDLRGLDERFPDTFHIQFLFCLYVTTASLEVKWFLKMTSPW